MCRRPVLLTLSGLLVGLLLLAAVGYAGVHRLLVVELESALGFEQTIETIQAAAERQGWKVPKTYRLCKSLAQHGYQVRPVAVIELCRPDYAARLLSQDASRLVSAFMPCRISVYEREDGGVVVAHMNTGLMGGFFPGEIGRVLGLASRDTDVILGSVLAVPAQGRPDTVAAAGGT